MLRMRIPALVLILAACACKREPSSARVDAAIAPLIPSDTVMLAGMRLDRLKGTPFYKTYVEGRKIPVLDRFREKTGLDPAKDIWELVYAGNPERSLVFIRGKFGGEFGLEPRFDAPGIKRASYKGYYILYSEQDQAGVLFLGPGVAAAGKVPDLHAIIDNRDKAGETPPTALLDMVGTLPASSQVWMVTRNAGSMVPGMPQRGNFANFARLATALGEASLYADLSSGIDLRAEGEYPDAALAKQVQDTVKALVGMARLRTPSDQVDLLSALEGVKAEARERKVFLTMQVPFKVVDQLVQYLPVQRSTSWQLESRPPDSSTRRPR